MNGHSFFAGGGPNGAALGPDGKIYLCNNGGFSWAPGPRGNIMRVRQEALAASAKLRGAK